MATSLDEAKDLRRHSPSAVRVISSARRSSSLSPTFQKNASRIRRGDIGRPCSARARYGWSGPWWSEWFYKPGGGCLFDLGVYCITSLTGLLGPAKRVDGADRRGHSRARRSTAGKSVSKPKTTRRCCSISASVLRRRHERLHDAAVSASGARSLWHDRNHPDAGRRLGPGRLRALAERGRLLAGVQGDRSGLAVDDGLRHFVECVRNGTTPLVTPEHALHVLEIMLKAQQSGREGRALEIESTFEPPTFAGAEPAEPAHLMHDRSRKHE